MGPFPPSSAVHCAHGQHLLWVGWLLSLPLPPITTTEPRQSRHGELYKMNVTSSCYNSSIKSQSLEGALDPFHTMEAITAALSHLRLVARIKM